jgi:rod shape-determining protein MreC
MRNLLNFLLRYNNLIVFLFLESIAISLLVSKNEYHNTRIVKTMQGVTRGVQEKINNGRAYLHLRDLNYGLAAENARLREALERYTVKPGTSFTSVSDTIFKQQYKFTPAEVINNSVNRQKNYFTLDKGKLQGISADMAVVSGNSVAGVVVGCSNNFSVAISLLNIDFRVSARIKSNGYFGSLTWNGHNHRYAVLNEIPQNVSINVGDTIETTGFSAIFPEGMQIGTVKDFRRSGSDFYRITVELTTDFKKIHYVDIIGNLKKQERTEIESRFK